MSREGKQEAGGGGANAFKTKLELFPTQPSVQRDVLAWGNRKCVTLSVGLNLAQAPSAMRLGSVSSD